MLKKKRERNLSEAAFSVSGVSFLKDDYAGWFMVKGNFLLSFSLEVNTVVTSNRNILTLYVYTDVVVGSISVKHFHRSLIKE